MNCPTFSKDRRTHGAMAALVIGPIFTAGAISGQVKQAKAAQEAALLSYQNAIISAFSDVENSLVSRQKLADQTKAQEAWSHR